MPALLRERIAAERVYFTTTFGVAPNLLVIHLVTWRRLCDELDLRGMMLGAGHWGPRPYLGMEVAQCAEVVGFRCCLSIDDRDSAKADLVVVR